MPDFDDDQFDEDEPFVVPIEDAIDLHTFAPREATAVLEEYFQACREKGILEVRVIHGKGTGQLKAKVESFLKKSAAVADFSGADFHQGGWGATMVRLKPLE